VDETLYYAQFLLSDRDRVRMVRAWLDEQSVPDDLLGRLRTRYSAAALARNLEGIRRRCEESGIERVDLLSGTLCPRRLQPLTDPPGVLFLRGNARLLETERAVGVVGARRGTLRGRRVAATLGAALGRAGILVVSGMALGVDGASHEGCLDVGGPALAWLASGVETVSPPSHRSLYRHLARDGLLASEYPPGTPVRKQYFVARNRLIAAYSEALVVVEAGERSGTRSTVDFALQLGRDLYCVPGPVDCPHSTGTLGWIREGATMIRGAADLLSDLGIAADRGEVDVVLGVGSVPESTQAIALRSGLPIWEVSAKLVEAEARGELSRLPGDRWCAR
jgi:DNA processing protein